MPVRIKKVHDVTDELQAAGKVDVEPLINMLDGAGNSKEHGIAYGLTYLRAQGGKNAIVHDPVEKDIGLALICDRDTSSVRQKKDKANPASGRRFNIADGIYLGSILAEKPEQAVFMNSKGVTILDKNQNRIEMMPEGVKLTPNSHGFHVDGDFFATGGVTAGYGTGDSVTLQHHKHPGTDEPTPGT